MTSVADGGDGDVVNFRVAAPDGAAGDGDFELAGEVVELGVAVELAGDGEGERGSVDELVGVEAGDGAAGDVADDVAAGSHGGEAGGLEGLDDDGQGLDGEPVELNGLAGGDVGEVAGVIDGEMAEGAELGGGEDAVGDGDTHHEVVGGEAFAAFAAGDAGSVALGVDAPPLEVEAGPLGEDGFAAFGGEAADVVPGLPGVLFELEALGALGFCFLGGSGRFGGRVAHGAP